MATHQHLPVLVWRNGFEVAGVGDDQIAVLADERPVGSLLENGAYVGLRVLEETSPFTVGYVHGVESVGHVVLAS